MSTVLLIEPLLTSVLAVRRDSMGTCRPSAGIHLLGLARRSGSCRSCRSEPVSPVSVPLGTDADCGPLVTLRPFARPAFRPVSTLLRPLLTPGTLSRVRSPRVRTDTFDPCRQALPDTSFGDGWISRSLARSSPVPGLTACSCSCGRVLATPFFQLGLAASTLGFATLLVTLRGYLLSGNKYMPMSGTLGWGDEGTPTLNSIASNQLGFASSPQPTKFATCTIRKKISIIKDYSLTARGSQHAQYHSQHQRGV